MTLYELTGTYLTLKNMMEDPEIDEQIILDTMESIEGDIEYKAENYAKIMAEMKAQSAMLKSEAERLTSRAKTIENKVDRMKRALQEAMILLDKRKFKTDLYSFTIQKNGGADPVILDVEPEKLPKVARVITTKADLKVMADLLRENPSKYKRFAHFGERGESLRIR